MKSVMSNPTRLRKDDAANISGIGASALTVAGIVVGAVVGLSLLAGLMPTFTGAVGDISENFTTADWGDTTANGISPIFAMLVSLGGLFAIIGLAFAAYKFKKGA